MTSKQRQIKRNEVAERNGYRPAPLPEHPEWAGIHLPAPIDEKAARAMAKLRGLAGRVA